MTFSEAYSLTYDKELAIKLMKADASQRKSEALESIAKSLNQCVGVYDLRIEKRG
jgi:hypothetical protein